jgi:S-DNA-T family DNA segregation ATPase FtsK/SpoIIIE
MSVVSAIKAQRDVCYESLETAQERQDSEPNDPLYGQVLEFLSTRHEVSTSLLQRAFKIGYNRSARIIDALEHEGRILPPDGAKMRKISKRDPI